MQHTTTLRNALLAQDSIFRLQPGDIRAIGKRIRQVRQAAGLKQITLAERVGMNQSGLSQVECGLVRPSLDLLIVLSSQYNAPIDWVLWNKGQNPTGLEHSRRGREMTKASW